MTPLIGICTCCAIALPGSSLVFVHHNFDPPFSGWAMIIGIILTGVLAGLYLEHKLTKKEK